MDVQTKRYVSLLCVWCVLQAAGLIIVVNGLNLQASIRRPVRADGIKEGGQVEMMCTFSTGDGTTTTGYTVEWIALNPPQTLRLGDQTAAGVNSRYTFHTVNSGWAIFQYFNITNVQRSDSNEYACTTRYTEGGSTVVTTSNVIMLSVLYFPSESFPICSPDGSITVDNGTELTLQCSSEAGNAAVIMRVFQLMATYYNGPYFGDMWISSSMNDTISRSLTLTVDPANANATFTCIIASEQFPNMTRSCDIGPITVKWPHPITSITPTIVSSELTHTPSFKTPLCTPDQTSSPWMAAFVVAVILLAVFVIFSTFLIYYVIKLRRLLRTTEGKATNVPTVDPYMELQRTDDSNKQYMDPATKGSTSAHHTYCQTLEDQDESHEYDYAKPEDKNSKYEEVRMPQN